MRGPVGQVRGFVCARPSARLEGGCGDLRTWEEEGEEDEGVDEERK